MKPVMEFGLIKVKASQLFGAFGVTFPVDLEQTFAASLLRESAGEELDEPSL